MRTTNRTVLDLSKVQHGSFWYVNQWGQAIHTLPNKEDVYVRGVYVKYDEPANPHPNFPGEMMRDRAKRLNIVDIWEPVVQFQLTANHSITYTGKKAVAMWKAWNERIFNKKKQ